MIEKDLEEVKVVWDPKKAYESFLEQFRLSLIANQMRAALREMPDSDMAQKTVKIKGEDGENRTISVAEYVVRLEVEAEEAKLDHFRSGGITAAEAYFYGRQGISYAGETPVPHKNTAQLSGKPDAIKL